MIARLKIGLSRTRPDIKKCIMARPEMESRSNIESSNAEGTQSSNSYLVSLFCFSIISVAVMGDKPLRPTVDAPQSALWEEIEHEQCVARRCVGEGGSFETLSFLLVEHLRLAFCSIDARTPGRRVEFLRSSWRPTRVSCFTFMTVQHCSESSAEDRL
ncbi:hypothetical protein ACROYT_G007081 [Oculina patagonica]